MSLLSVMALPFSVSVSLLLFVFVSMPVFASLAVPASVPGLSSMSLTSFPFVLDRFLDMVFRVAFPKFQNMLNEHLYIIAEA